MTIDDKITDEKLQYSITGAAEKNQHCHMKKLINMNILQVKKYCLIIKDN